MDTSTRPTGTSAAATAFCADRIEGPGGFLWVDGNGKITAGNGTLDAPKPNAFSLLHIDDCPFSTDACRKSCYVHGLQQHAPDTYELYKDNSAMMRYVLAGPAHVAMEWETLLANYITKNCAGGFRWHVSGDIFSERYATFIAMTCMKSPRVNHWIYTRSFPYVHALMDVSTTRGGNLAINISIDKNNRDAGMAVAKRYGLRRCYMVTHDGGVPFELTDDGAVGDVIFPDYSLRGGNTAGQDWFASLRADQKACVCPVDFHGKAENRRCGPCGRCLS